jgi:hypothetical protein
MRDAEITTIVRRSQALRRLFAEETLILTIDCASELTGVARTTIYRMCRDKGIAVESGGVYFIGANRLLRALTARNCSDLAFADLRRAIDVSSNHGNYRHDRLAKES